MRRVADDVAEAPPIVAPGRRCGRCSVDWRLGWYIGDQRAAGPGDRRRQRRRGAERRAARWRAATPAPRARARRRRGARDARRACARGTAGSARPRARRRAVAARGVERVAQHGVRDERRRARRCPRSPGTRRTASRLVARQRHAGDRAAATSHGLGDEQHARIERAVRVARARGCASCARTPCRRRRRVRARRIAACRRAHAASRRSASAYVLRPSRRAGYL